MSLTKKTGRILEDMLGVFKISLGAFELVHERNFELAPREWMIDQVAKILADPSTHKEIAARIDQINSAAVRRFIFEKNNQAIRAADEGVTRWMEAAHG
jgi:hypothetical protein